MGSGEAVRVGRMWIAATPVVLLLILWSDHTADRMLRGRHASGFEMVGSHDHRPGAGFIPALRSFLVQAWLVRIDASLRAGRTHQALRLCREILALAPDLPLARVRLSAILAYRLAPMELDEARRLAWIAEGLAILDEGLLRNPFDAALHTERGLLIWSRGDAFAGFESAFRRTYSTSCLEEGVRALVQGAEFARGNWEAVRKATIGLQQRGDFHLAAGSQGDPERLLRAEEDFERAGSYLRELLEFSALAPAALRVDLAHAETSAALCRFNGAVLAGRDGEDRSLLARVRETREVLRTGVELGPARARLAAILADVLAPRARDPALRRGLLEEAAEILEEGRSRDPDGAPLYEDLLQQIRERLRAP